MTKRYASRIRELINTITQKLPTNTPDLQRRFVELFYRKLPLVELEGLVDQHSVVVAQDAYQFFFTHQQGIEATRVFYPTTSEHGYNGDYVVVQCVNRDQPFLVDSLTNAINLLGITIHTIVHPIFKVARDEQNRLTALEASNSENKSLHPESFIHLELSGLPEDMEAETLRIHLDHVLNHARLATADWKALLNKTVEAREALSYAQHYNEDDIYESQEFLDWLMHKNFVYLGYVKVDFNAPIANQDAHINTEDSLGISKIDDIPETVHIGEQLVDVRKASRYSKVHRHALMDVVTVKRINMDGSILGEHRFYGLFTSSAYYQNARQVPLVRRKVDGMINEAGFAGSSHNGKALAAILQFMPRDELFQMQEGDLFTLSMGLLALEKRPGVKLFARMDLPRRYISALVYVPRELFSTTVRRQVTQTLEKHYHATLENYETLIGESPLARLHVTLRTSAETPDTLNSEAIERDIATSIMLWPDRLKEALHKRHELPQADQLFTRYAHAFDEAYTSRYPILSTVYDIAKMESCRTHHGLDIELYRERDEADSTLHIKIYNAEENVALSDILPQLENMGLRVIDEFPYTVKPKNEASLHIRDIRVELAEDADFSLPQVKPNFEALLLSIWRGEVEDDGLNALVFHAGLHMQQIEVLRACYKYLRQINIGHGKHMVSKALRKHAELTVALVQYFETRFDPNESQRKQKLDMLDSKLEQGRAAMDVLDEDRVFDTFQKLMAAMMRSNYYVRQPHFPAGVLSFKLRSELVPNIPLPKPYMEIFVYSARVEGVHLRGGKVARGGLRWSDRPNDFRTEVLGLMKAQMVKNAVIVPVGSKGGFVVKQVAASNRDAFRKEGVECYKAYLRGMLDITDNIKDGEIIAPKNVVRHDGDDPYLVVAADKGTASFSDTANGVSADYDFWLGDAFASGGSVGYDHKEMGITARGAWVSVEQHFREMGKDISRESFTVAGIGDMSGDVFGNGMLLSENIALVAAFNHLHIFLDPTPDVAKSFAERQRLFELPRSSWQDYDASLISEGGGIYERSAKQIDLTPATQKALGTDKASCSPDELIQIILTAPVDLLWNGGIGTYVKAASESHDEVGDRANNNVRVNGAQLRAKIVGEGGNLGLTQLGRIEYARNDGRINTDAIDNSAGVDCSDHEVNIKIALKKAVQDGTITTEQRNTLLASMTDEVAKLVLKDNHLQTQAISIEQYYAAERLPQHIQLMRTLEQRGLLDRAIEYLPSDTQLHELRQCGQGLSRPEISVLLAYSKIALFSDVVDSEMPDESYFDSDLQRYFPAAMRRDYEHYISEHSLKREIIGTVATNSMVNRAGISFFSDIQQDTQLPSRDIVVAYSLARDIFRMRDIWSAMEAMAEDLSLDANAALYADASALLKHATFWLLRHRPLPLDVDGIMAEFCSSMHGVMEHIPLMLGAGAKKSLDKAAKTWTKTGLPEAIAARAASLPWLYSALDIASLAQSHSVDAKTLGSTYFKLAASLRIRELIDRAAHITADNRWDRLARQSLEHGLYDEMARLTSHVFSQHDGAVEAFTSSEKDTIGRFANVVDDMLSRESLSSPMMMVALQQLKQVGSE